jgi:DNA-binding beta-propeller fold protein YncE
MGQWLLLAGFALAVGTPAVRADKLVTVAGGGDKRGEPAPAPQAKLVMPFGIDFDRAGNAYLVELNGGHVHKIDKAGLLTTISGTGKKGAAGDGGPAKQASFNGMHNLAVTPGGDLYIADTWNNKIRKIDGKTGVITTVAGTGVKGYGGDDGPAVQAQFGGIYCATLDPKGENLYLADLDNRRVRVVNLASGVVRLVAGNGKKGVPPDGADAKTAPLVDPRAVTVDDKGNVYILERGGHALRVVDAAGKIRTLAGTGKAGLSGDGGPALKAALNGPKHLCLDRAGDVIIADTANHVIRKYSVKDGTIVRVAGTGKKGSQGGDGPPLQAQFNEPHGVYVSPAGELYIVDSNNDRVLKVVK